MRIVGNEVSDANCTVYYKQICTSDALDWSKSSSFESE